METVIKGNQKQQQEFPKGLYLVAILMILFGLAEIVTSYGHEFLGLITLQTNEAAIIGAVIGASYFISGLLVLTRRRKAAEKRANFTLEEPTFKLRINSFLRFI